MTLTRDMRTALAFILAIFVAFSLFVWGNQRQAQATLATEILCLVDQVGDEGDGNTGIFPMFEEDCEGQGGEIIDYCPNIPGTQDQDDLPCTEEPAEPQCNDGIDNDNDGKTDWGVPGDENRDPGCSTPTDDDESDDPSEPTPMQCADGLDNDNDGLVDMNDPGCSSAEDNDESNGGGGGNEETQCSDGVDNDGDNLVDSADPGCTDENDDDETNEGGNGGNNGGNTECSDGVDNDSDDLIDFPADSDCSSADDDSEQNSGGGGGGGGSHRRSSSQGEILGAQIGECSMYLTGYIRYGAQNDMGEVLKLQSFLNDFEGNTLEISGIYDAPTLAAVNAFQAKYAAEVLTPWGMRGPSGYVYYTTQKMINTIYCRGQKEFPLSATQLSEIAGVRSVQPTLRVGGQTGSSQGASQDQIGSTAPAVGSVVLPTTSTDENTGIIDAESATAGAANAPSTQGWFSRFVNWLFGR